jgi:predicted outer membrane repeat protein
MSGTNATIRMTACVVFLTAAGIVQGRTITVDDDGPADFNAIQAAIDDANGGDVVEIQAGVYTGDGNRDVNFAGKAITVRSTDANDPNVVAATVIDCQGSPRAFNFRSGEGPNSALEGLTIKNAYSWQTGGAIFCEGSSPTIINCIFYYNISNVGGIEAGGAIAIVAGSSPVITNCVFEQNQGYTRGGAIACSNSEVLIEGCTFIENYQGAILGFGGGIYLEAAIATINSCLFIGNSADVGGGAIGAVSGSQAEIVNCAFVGNKSRSAGGAIYDGGMFGLPRSQFTLTNCIFWSNMVETPDRGDHISGGGGIIGHCDVEGGWDGPGVVDSSLVDGGGNIDVDPCFADLGAWSGPNPWDPWIVGDYHLQSGVGRWDPNSESWVIDDVTSPCIDRGDPNSSVGDEPDPNGGRINIGAYGGTAQASKSATCWDASACAGQPYGDATCDGTINLADLFALKIYWAQVAPWVDPECCADFSRDGKVSLADLFALKAGFGTSGYSPSIGNQLCPP